MNPNRTRTSNILLEWTWTNLNLENGAQVNPNQTWTSKMGLKWTRTKPEPLKFFEQGLNLNPNRYLKRRDGNSAAYAAAALLLVHRAAQRGN